MHLDGIIPLLKLKYNEKRLVLYHKVGYSELLFCLINSSYKPLHFGDTHFLTCCFTAALFDVFV